MMIGDMSALVAATVKLIILNIIVLVVRHLIGVNNMTLNDFSQDVVTYLYNKLLM